MDKCPRHDEQDRRQREVEQAVAVMGSSAKEMSTLVREFVKEVRGNLSEGSEKILRLEIHREQTVEHIETLFGNYRKIEETVIPKVQQEVKDCRDSIAIRFSEISKDQRESYQAIAKRLQPVEAKHLREEGGWKMLKDLRVGIPVLFSVVLGLLQVWQWIVPFIQKAVAK